MGVAVLSAVEETVVDMFFVFGFWLCADFGAGQTDENVFERDLSAAGSADDLGTVAVFVDYCLRRVDGDDFAMINDGDAVADGFGFFHRVGGQENPMAFVSHCFDPCPELAAGLWVEAGRGLVHEDQLWIVDRSDNQGYALLLASGELAKAFADMVEQHDFGKERSELIVVEFNAVETGVERDDLADGQFGLEAGGLQLYSHAGAGVDGLTADVVAGDADGAGRRFDQSFGGAEGAGLAGSIWAEETKDLTGADLERDFSNGLEGSVEDVQVFDLENGLVSWRIHGC